MRAIAVSVLAVAISAAQAPPPAERAIPVRIDVLVTDARQRPVENLQPQDFELREDGAVQQLDSVRFVTQ